MSLLSEIMLSHRERASPAPLPGFLYNAGNMNTSCVLAVFHWHILHRLYPNPVPGELVASSFVIRLCCRNPLNRFVFLLYVGNAGFKITRPPSEKY